MRRQRYLKLFVAGVIMGIFALGLVPVGAASADISHSYQAGSNITPGSIVSLDPQQSDYVQAANINNGSRLLGVVVGAGGSLIALDPTTGTVQVAISGTVNTLVSTINGPINIGDQIAVSPFSGVGMKALSGSHVIGLAQSALSASSSNVITQQVTNKQGGKSQIKIGYIRISIATGVDTAGSEEGLNSLQKFAQSIVGHPVSTLRIILCVVVSVFALVALIVLIYASVHSSIIAIGRNPLARYSIFRSLAITFGLAIITAGLACVTIFFLLR